MAILLRVMCWNIAEGSLDRRLPENSTLPRIADEIRRRYPDVVLLNELKNWRWPFGGGVHQARHLASLTKLHNVNWGNTNATGVAGHKAVAVLSRYGFGSPRLHPVMRGDAATGYATLEVTGSVDNITVHAFSTRFDAHNDADRMNGHRQAGEYVRSLDPGHAVVFGGDFNSGIPSAELKAFTSISGLTNVFAELRDPDAATGDPIDHIFYRGPYRVRQMQLRSGPAETSDHPWVLVELVSPPDGFAARYGNFVKLKHHQTGGSLHSHPLTYGHPGTSGQQQVTAYEGADDNDLWRIKGPNRGPNQAGRPVLDGHRIRLEHVLTRRNLHSHARRPSPVTRQQEVTCFGNDGRGDDNDDWRLEVEGGGPWEAGKRIRLIHLGTNHALHSHANAQHPQWTNGQQEVTAYAGRDDNDWWYLFHQR